jgi:uncharacterized protein YdaU (DUF1376 family)
MSRPWMPLYVADYLAATAHLSAAQSGAYLHLIMHYWWTGGLPDDDGALARIARMSRAQWRRARPVIEKFFAPGWKHKRVEFELVEAARLSRAGRAGGVASGAARRAEPNQAMSDRCRKNRWTMAQRSCANRSTIRCRSSNDRPNDPATMRQRSAKPHSHLPK